MKKRIISVLLSFVFMVIIPVSATCSTQIFYSEKQWVKHQDFFDTPFTSQQKMMINSYQIAASINALGTLSFPNRVDSDVLSGKKELTVHGTENTDEYPLIAVYFGKTIKIDQMIIECSGKDETGQVLDKSIWANVDIKNVNGKNVVVSGEKLLTTSEDRIVLNMDSKQIKNLYVLFDNATACGEYEFRYLQIPFYQAYEHVKWTSTPIENTEIKQIQVCLDRGKYEPDGSSGVWKKEVSGVFTPSTTLIMNHTLEIDSQSPIYDYGRGNHIPAYSYPDIVKGIDSYSSHISGWIDEQEGKYHQFWSYGEKGKEWPYIETKPGWGIRYQVDPVYWTQQRNLPDKIWQSEDPSWCQHTTGSRRTPCYKYKGHHSNSRFNSYDVNLITYKNLYNPQDHIVVAAKYSIKNADTGEIRLLAEKDDTPYLFSLNENGRWILSAQLKDESGNSGTAESRLYLIDNQVPEVEYLIENTEDWKNKPVPVVLMGKDRHSGVKQMRWAVSHDGGKHFTDFSSWVKSDKIEMTLQDNGIMQFKTEVEDYAGNRNIVYSPLVRIDRVAPVVERTWVKDEITGKIICDTLNENRLWINAASKLKIMADPVYDLPHPLHSGIGSVTATYMKEAIVLNEKNGIYEGFLQNMQEGENVVELVAEDKAGNQSEVKRLKIPADLTGPEIKWKIVPEKWTNQNVHIQIESVDNLSGTASISIQDQKTNDQKMTFIAENNGQYEVVSEDKAGNRTKEMIEINNIDRIVPSAIFDPFQVETVEKELIVHIQPEDQQSGIERWRYKITYDEGKSYIYTSQWISSDQLTEVKLNMAGKCRIVAELQDRAGNHGEVMSGIYHLSEGDASAASLMIPAVSSSQQGQGMLRAVCRDCNPKKKQRITIWQESEKIYEQETDAFPEQTIHFPFQIKHPDTLFEAVIEYENDTVNENNKLSLTASPVTEQFIRSSQEQIEFTGIVMYTADQQKTKNYQEHLTLFHPLPDSGIFAGQPIASVITTHYDNECSRVENWACVGQTSSVSGHIDAFYDQGALPVREKYEFHGRYKVPMINEENRYHIPQMWVTQFEGWVNDDHHFESTEDGEKILDGGYNWYTDPASEIKTVHYEFIGKNFAVNQFSFRFDRTIDIDQKIKDSYRARFVNPEDDQTLHSLLWDPYLEWFKQLKGKKPIQIK